MFAFFKSTTLLYVMVVIANKIDVVKIVVKKLSKLNNNKELSQTRRWSRLKPTVIVVDKTTTKNNFRKK